MKYIITLSFIFLTFFLSAQNCTDWFPFKKGSTFEYSFYDKKDKMTGRMAYEVTDMKAIGDGYSYTIATKMFDKKDKEMTGFEFSVMCAEGSYRANVSNFMNPQMKELFGEMDLKVSGEDLVIPKKLSVGQKLPDASSTTEAEVGIVNMKVEVFISNREVVDLVAVQTPLQKFEAFKITSSEHVKMPMMKRDYSSIAYYVEGVGQVKSESLDKKGQVASYMLLTKFNP